MNYHNITHNDMLNGDGIRVVLWVAGCNHHCIDCQNPETWDVNGGIPFGKDEVLEIIRELQKPYVKGITFSGGDPLHPDNRKEVYKLSHMVYSMFEGKKDVWLYTGYKFEDIDKSYLKYVNILVDGEFEPDLKDNNYQWCGSTNQRVIDVKKSLKEGEIVLYESN